MNEMKPISKSHNNIYRVAIILLLAYAALSAAMKDLNRLQEVAGEVHQYTSLGVEGLVRVYSATRSLAQEPQLARGPVSGSTSEARDEVLAAGGSVELKGLACETDKSVTELPTVARADRDSSMSSFREVKYMSPEIITGVKQEDCELRKRQQRKVTGKEFQWNALAQAPKRFVFLRDRVRKAGDIDVESFARSARIKINKLPARSSRVQWPNVKEFKSLDEILSLRLLPAHKDAVEAGNAAEEAVEEVSLPLLEKVKRGVIDEETNNAHK